MLRAYFDDSGSHDSSEVVVIAGVMGLECEIETLDQLWGEVLANPLEGTKGAVTEFHSYECFQSVGEFSGWKRLETDYLRRRLRDVIIRSKVSGYGFACVRKDWDSEISGENVNIFGDSEGYAFTSCFIRSLRWASNFTFDPEMSFVFDQKPERESEIRKLFEAFQLHEKNKTIIDLDFCESKNCHPLQAADMFAWEFNRWARDILRIGHVPPTTDEMKHLAKNMYFVDGQIARRDKIREMRDAFLAGVTSKIDPKFIADYFFPVRPKRK